MTTGSSLMRMVVRRGNPCKGVLWAVTRAGFEWNQRHDPPLLRVVHTN